MNTITQITTRRQAIIKYAEKKGVTAAARRYNVGRASIYRWMKRYDGTLESLKICSRKTAELYELCSSKASRYRKREYSSMAVY